MAIPPGMRVPPKREVAQAYGYIVNVVPTDWRIGTELQVSTASSAGSTGWVTHSVRQGGAVQQPWYRVETPNDNKTRYFRARQTGPSYQAGPWFPSTASTITVGGVPQEIPETNPPGIQVLFDGTDGIVTNSVKPGTPGASTCVTKTIKFPAASFLPLQSTDAGWVYANGALYQNTTGTASFTAAFPVPTGVVVTGYRVFGEYTSTNDIVSVALKTVTNTGSLVSLSTVSLDTTGFTNKSSTSSTDVINETMTTGKHLVADLTIRNTTAAGIPKLFHVQLTYDMDDYSKAY